MNKALFGLAVLVFSLLTFQTATRFTFRTGVATDTRESRTASLHPTINDSLDIVGRVTKYNNIATEGYGVPAVVDVYFSTAESAALTQSNISSAVDSGAYRVGLSLSCSGIAAGTDSVYAKIGWNTEGGMKYDSTAWLKLSAAGVYTHKTIVVYHTSGDTMTFQTVFAGSAGDLYDIMCVTERLR